jgi:hypothetical protein
MLPVEIASDVILTPRGPSRARFQSFPATLILAVPSGPRRRVTVTRAFLSGICLAQGAITGECGVIQPACCLRGRRLGLPTDSGGRRSDCVVQCDDEGQRTRAGDRPHRRSAMWSARPAPQPHRDSRRLPDATSALPRDLLTIFMPPRGDSRSSSACTPAVPLVAARLHGCHDNRNRSRW